MVILKAIACLGMLALTFVPVKTLAEPLSTPLLHRYATTERSWDVNAFWLESADGLVLIDTLLLKSDAQGLVAAMKQTGKPLAGVIITHPHIDHFGGMAVIRDAFPGVHVYATHATAAGMTAVHERAIRQGWVVRMFGDDYETELKLPDRLVESGTALNLAGMHFKLEDVGAIDASNNSIVLNTDLNVLFAGDAAVANATIYVGEGHSASGERGLEDMNSRFGSVARVYSGHYDPMRPGPLFDENLTQFRYLRSLMASYLDDAANRAPDGQLSTAARERLVNEVAAHFIGHRNYGYGPRGFADLNLPALELEMIAERAKAPTPDMPKGAAGNGDTHRNNPAAGDQ